MPPLNRSENTQKHWRSLAELEATPEFLEKVGAEFEAGDEESWTTSSRRRFLQLMGASVALAGATGCTWKKENIAPLADRPEDWVPGTSKSYASSFELGGYGTGLNITSYDGRPVKVEGNKLDPNSNGATSTWAQAAMLELYDPDRSRGVAKFDGGAETESDWAAFDAWASANLKGTGAAILSEASASPSFLRMKDAWLAANPGAKWFTYEPVNRDNERAGCELAFGEAVQPDYNTAAAKVILTLDDDLFHMHPTALRNSRGFAKGRRPEDGHGMNRLWSVESTFSPTGGQADHRLPIRSSQVDAFLAALEAELGLGQAAAPRGGFLAEEKTQAFLKALAKDLLSHKGAALISVGPDQPAGVHARAQLLNVALGAMGKTVEYRPAALVYSGVGELASLAKAVKSGAVKSLMILGGNPVYNAPGDADFAGLLAELKGNTAHLSLYRDETSLACGWHAPRAHFLEAWADTRGWDGSYTVAQPSISPLWGGRSMIEQLAAMMGEPTMGFTLVRETFKASVGKSDKAWRQAVHDGYVASKAKPVAVSAGQMMPPEFNAATLEGQGLEIAFRADASVWDGRFANSGWLQELPDSMTKMTWDNALLMAPATATAQSLTTGSMVKVDVNGQSIEAAVYVLPGHAQKAATLTLGYGRTAAGHVGGLVDADIRMIGFNANALRTSKGMGWASASISATGATYELAQTQEHHLIDQTGMDGREQRMPAIAREGSLSEFNDHPDFAAHRVHHPANVSLFDKRLYDTGHKWGMTIDLATCNGCNGCTIACQSENNIPVVGKEQVIAGREMSWIRMDRYYSGDADDPQAINMPVSCTQCEMAPCEEVCPAGATTHSSEGLNDMAYNRCIGTRYCANNCPVKVRRFNFFDFTEPLSKPGNETLHLMQNPEVTVRSRGVMEKCTYCVQRIHTGKHDARNEGRELQDGDIVPACAQVCPTDAIVFGDLNDPESAVTKAYANPRNYELLSELNLQMRTHYLARIRNPHPDLAVEETAGHNAHAATEEVHHG